MDKKAINWITVERSIQNNGKRSDKVEKEDRH